MLSAAGPSWVGSETCAACHAAIYKRYMSTPMARSSGVIGQGALLERFDNAAFTHERTGYRYRVSRTGSRYFLEFEKGTGPARVAGGRPLPYFVGSGAAARSYLLTVDGFLYEAPVTYYTQRNQWDLSPGYDRHEYPFLTRPIVPGCLQCHASRLQHQPPTLNGFETPPFLEAGIACERCHGPGAAHIARMKSGAPVTASAIVNPAKLTPESRDSVCEQCHLSGEARVVRAGRAADSFVAGDRLVDHVAVFVRSGGSAGMKVTSHVENLAQSVCKQAAGDRLWCGSCHDPHAPPAPAERAAWFRSKCLGCHAADSCKTTAAARRARANDCTACHMPRNPVADAEHVVYTDHSIPRRPGVRGAPAKSDAPLVLFSGGDPAPRDLALAYALMAQQDSGNAAYKARALDQLRRLADPDSETMVALADLYRASGQPEAEALYARAILADPSQLTAPVNLGAIHMERGEYAEAIRLWQDALSKNPGLVLVRGNLALALMKSGNPAEAKAVLKKAVDFNPLFGLPGRLLDQIRQAIGKN